MTKQNDIYWMTSGREALSTGLLGPRGIPDRTRPLSLSLIFHSTLYKSLQGLTTGKTKHFMLLLGCRAESGECITKAHMPY